MKNKTKNVFNDRDLIQDTKYARTEIANVLKGIEKLSYCEEEFTYILESIAADINYEVARRTKDRSQ